MKILLAEDEQQLAHVFKIAMENAGYVVDTVGDGQAAIEAAAQNAYDVMIFDIMMPKKSGLEALTELRAAGNHTYMIMLTAMDGIDDKVTGLDSGADDYLTKPISLKELLARLRSLERRSENFTEPVLSFSDLKVDCTEQRLSSRNSLSLSNKETRLVSFMIANADKELPVTQLLDQAWDRQETADENDVWIYISYLRQKLQAVGSKATIHGPKEGPFILSAN